MILLSYWPYKNCLFVYLFVFLFIFSFYLSHLGIPPGRYSESFVRIGLVLADILSSNKIVNLCVYLFVCVFFLFFSFGSYQGTPRKISWKFWKHWNGFSWDIVDLKNCLFACLLFICLFVCIFFNWVIPGYPQNTSLKVL